MFILGWALGSVIVAILAGAWRGRNPSGWLIISLITSPFIAFLILCFMKDLRPELAVKIEIFDIGHFRERLTGLESLKSSGVYTKEEFMAKRQGAVHSLSFQRISGTEEEFLVQMSQLVEENLLSIDELKDIKRQREERQIARAA